MSGSLGIELRPQQSTFGQDTSIGPAADVAAAVDGMGTFGLPPCPKAKAGAAQAGVEGRGGGMLWAAGHARDMKVREETRRLQPAPEAPQKLSGRAAVITLVITGIGPGIVGMPVLFSEGGWAMATVGVFLVSTTMMQCGALLCDVCDALERHEGLVVDSYESLAQRLGGVCWERAVIVAKNGAMLGTLTAFMAITVDNISGIIGDESVLQSASKTKMRFLVVFPMFAALSLTNKMDTVRKLSEFSIGSTAVFVFCILYGSFGRYGDTDYYDPHSHEEHTCVFTRNPVSYVGNSTTVCRSYHAWTTWYQASFQLLILGRIMAYTGYNLAIIGTVPMVRSQLKDRAIMKSVVYKAVGFTVVAYVALSVVAYRGFGDKLTANVVNGFDDIPPRYPTVAVIAGGFVIINVLLGAPLFSLECIQWAETLGSSVWCESLTRPNVFLRFCLMAALATLTYYLPFFMEICVITGCLFCMPGGVIFPIVFAQKAAHLLGEPPTTARTLFRIWVVLVAIFVMVFGVLGAREQIDYDWAYEQSTGIAWQ